MKTIYIGKENATFQEIIALKENRKKRNQLKKFFVEGVQNIKEALANNWQIFAFIYNDYNKLSNWAKEVIKRSEINYCLAQKLMIKLSDKNETSELLAIIHMKAQSINLKNNNPLLVLLDRPSKKGNFGTLIRSCDALFVDHIFFTGHSVDIYDHNVITSSMGSFFSLPFTFLKSNEDYEHQINWLKTHYKSFQIIGTSLQTNLLVQNHNFKKPTLLLIGNESKGLSKYYNDMADALVKIKMKDGINSLNIACAATACLYEISKQRS